ncbi:MAG: hypothetical protein KAJ60_05855, partial [Desulfobulbaceae bacterium]|nr:hypothetical protein [Desulfobulbaceae bacterium]
HRSLGKKELSLLAFLGEKLAATEYLGVVTLELYRKDWLEDSLNILLETWGRFGVEALLETDFADAGDVREKS